MGIPKAHDLLRSLFSLKPAFKMGLIDLREGRAHVEFI